MVGMRQILGKRRTDTEEPELEQFKARSLPVIEWDPKVRSRNGVQGKLNTESDLTVSVCLGSPRAWGKSRRKLGRAEQLWTFEVDFLSLNPGSKVKSNSILEPQVSQVLNRKMTSFLQHNCGMLRAGTCDHQC